MGPEITFEFSVLAALNKSYIFMKMAVNHLKELETSSK